MRWVRLSSSTGELPLPGPSTQQTGSLAADLDGDGATDFVIAFREKPPALVWYRHARGGWARSVIERDFLTVEAGGAAHDIDGDGDLDIVFGADWQGEQVWWWENPGLADRSNSPWKRRLIKDGGGRQHHDQAFGDFKGTGRAQLAFWNQGRKALFLADVPKDPRATEPWPYAAIFTGPAGEGGGKAAHYAEGAFPFDVDGDGRVDLLAGNMWLKHVRGSEFRAVRVAEAGGRIAAARFKPGKVAQIVVSSGDGTGPLMLYECRGDPESPADWVGRDLIGRPLVHGHGLEVADIDGDGNLDILAAEMASWTAPSAPDNPRAQAFILYGDGKGGFRTTVLTTGEGWHEPRLGDFDGDGDLDILQKPYTWKTPRVDLWLNGGTR